MEPPELVNFRRPEEAHRGSHFLAARDSTASNGSKREPITGSQAGAAPIDSAPALSGATDKLGEYLRNILQFHTLEPGVQQDAGLVVGRVYRSPPAHPDA